MVTSASLVFRSLSLSVATVGAVVLITLLVVWLGTLTAALHLAAVLWLVVVVVVMPFFVVPLHHTLQASGGSSVLRALLAGLSSWAVTAAFTVHWYFSTFGV